MIISAYRIRNEATGKSATVAPDNRIRQFTDIKAGTQRFIKLSGGKTRLASRGLSPNLVVDAIGGDLTGPAALQMYPSHGGPNQMWKFKEEGTRGTGSGGYYVHSIRADDTDMVWDIPFGDPADGNYVQIYEFNGGDNQMWRVDQKVVETVVIHSEHSNRVLDVPGFASGIAYIQDFTANGGFNQAWIIEDVPGDTGKRIQSVSSGLYLTSTFVTTANDALVYQWTPLNLDTQLWELDLNDAGVGTIQNRDNDFFLGVVQGPQPTANQVLLTAGSAGQHKQWKVIE